MKLFMVHCGFYDENLGSGAFESHTNYFVVAKDACSAKESVKNKKSFKEKKMHIDSLQLIKMVDGYFVCLKSNFENGNHTDVEVIRHRQLAIDNNSANHENNN